MRFVCCLGAGTIVHPRAEILAESGPIVFGENCLIDETAKIINRWVGIGMEDRKWKGLYFIKAI